MAVLYSTVGFASSIGRITLSELEAKADFIVMGQVMSVEEEGNIDHVIIKVDAYIKGDASQTEYKFTLVTRGGLKDFDPDLKKGQSGVFFLKQQGQAFKKAYWGSVAIFSENHFLLTTK